MNVWHSPAESSCGSSDSEDLCFSMYLMCVSSLQCDVKTHAVIWAFDIASINLFALNLFKCSFKFDSYSIYFFILVHISLGCNIYRFRCRNRSANMYYRGGKYDSVVSYHLHGPGPKGSEKILRLSDDFSHEKLHSGFFTNEIFLCSRCVSLSRCHGRRQNNE